MAKILLVLFLFLPSAARASVSVDLASGVCYRIVLDHHPKATVDGAIAFQKSDGSASTMIHGDIYLGIRPFEYVARCIFGKKGAKIKFQAIPDLRRKL